MDQVIKLDLTAIHNRRRITSSVPMGDSLVDVIRGEDIAVSITTSLDFRMSTFVEDIHHSFSGLNDNVT